MHCFLEDDITSVVCYHYWCSHLHLYTFFIQAADILLLFPIFYPLLPTLIFFFIDPQIQLPTTGPDTSSSDSSDFSSEDDSTVVLMKTRSRSPSPRKGKHRKHRSGSLGHGHGHSHSRSRSGSPAPAKVKGLDVTDGPQSSSTAESKTTGCPAEGSSSLASAPGEKDKNLEDSGVWCTTKSCWCHWSHSQLLCLLFDTFTMLYVFCTENMQFLMPSFSGKAVWLVQKAHFALSCLIKLCTLYILLFVNLPLCPVFLLSLSVLRCGQNRELTPCIKKYSRIYSHVEWKQGYLLL